MTPLDPDELRGVAGRVLDEPEFREPEPGLVQRVIDVVGDLIGELVEGLGGGGAGSIIGWAIVVAAIGGLVWLLVRLVPDVRVGQRRSGGPVRRGPIVDVSAGRSAASWDDEAAEHEAAGRWDDALRARYRGIVARLARRGAVRDAPSVTTGEHRADLHDGERRPVDVGAFSTSADRFDEVWYGGSAASSRDVEQARRLAEEVDRDG